jgi:hypothetical protein
MSAKSSTQPSPDRKAPTTESMPPRARRLLIWSWVMVPAVLVSYLLAFAVGTVLMGALDVPEGKLITTAGVAGWVAGVCVLGIGVVPSIAGSALARRALRSGGGAWARAALVVNVLLLCYFAVVSLAQMALG